MSGSAEAARFIVALFASQRTPVDAGQATDAHGQN